MKIDWGTSVVTAVLAAALFALPGLVLVGLVGYGAYRFGRDGHRIKLPAAFTRPEQIVQTRPDTTTHQRTQRKTYYRRRS